MREADHWTAGEGGAACCGICPHACEIAPGAEGLCGVRRNWDGVLYADGYEEVARVEPLPVERLPLFHYAPGSMALAVGGIGESFPRELASPARPLGEAGETETRFAAIHELIDIAAGRGLEAIAYSGGEPFMWFEQLRETAARAREEGLANLLVTNAFACAAPAGEVAPLIDAACISLLGPARAYERRARAQREAVLETVAILRGAGVHVEAALLILPGENDDDASLDEVAALVRERLGGAPLHVESSLDPETAAPVKTLLRVAGRLAAALPHVYLSNVYSREANDTACLACGAILVDRLGARVATPGLAADGRCLRCGAAGPFRMRRPPRTVPGGSSPPAVR